MRTPSHGSRPSVSSSRNTHRLAASRTASITAWPTAMWSAWSRPPPSNVGVVVRHDHDLGPVAADHPRDVAAEGQAVLDHAVGMAEELHGGDADEGGRLPLLPLPHRARLLRRHRVDPGLAARHQAVGDRLALRGPPGHRRGRAVLHVVGMRDHGERAAPRLVDRVAASPPRPPSVAGLPRSLSSHLQSAPRCRGVPSTA